MVAQVLQHRQGLGIGPVEILQNEQRSPSAIEGPEKAHDCFPEGQRPDLVRRTCLRASPLRHNASDDLREWRELLLIEARRGRKPACEGLGQGTEWSWCTSIGGPAEQNRPTLRERSDPRFADEPRLADTRLAEHQHQLTAGLRQRDLKRVGLGLAADQRGAQHRGHPPAVCIRRVPDEAPNAISLTVAQKSLVSGLSG